MSFLNEEVLENALTVIGLKNVNKIDASKILSKYLKGDTHDPIRIESKNNLLIHLIESQNLGFDYQIPIGNKCSHCNGRGFDFLLFKVEEARCKLTISIDPFTKKRNYEGCNGTGFQISECKSCYGTGKVGESPCPTCFDKIKKKANGTYIYKKTKKHPGKKCLKCNGTGKIKKLVQRESEIKNISLCKKCNGTGISDKVETPLINSEVGKKLKKLVDSKT